MDASTHTSERYHVENDGGTSPGSYAAVRITKKNDRQERQAETEISRRRRSPEAGTLKGVTWGVELHSFPSRRPRAGPVFLFYSSRAVLGDKSCAAHDTLYNTRHPIQHWVLNITSDGIIVAVCTPMRRLNWFILFSARVIVDFGN